MQHAELDCSQPLTLELYLITLVNATIFKIWSQISVIDELISHDIKSGIPLSAFQCSLPRPLDYCVAISLSFEIFFENILRTAALAVILVADKNSFPIYLSSALLRTLGTNA